MSHLLCETCREKIQTVTSGLTATEVAAFDELEIADRKDFRELLFDLVRNQQESPHVRSTALNILSSRLLI